MQIARDLVIIEDALETLSKASADCSKAVSELKKVKDDLNQQFTEEVVKILENYLE